MGEGIKGDALDFVLAKKVVPTKSSMIYFEHISALAFGFANDFSMVGKRKGTEGKYVVSL